MDQWVGEHWTAPTSAISAVRMLRECGGIRNGIGLDIGCGSGRLDELIDDMGQRVEIRKGFKDREFRDQRRFQMVSSRSEDGQETFGRRCRRGQEPRAEPCGFLTANR